MTREQETARYLAQFKEHQQTLNVLDRTIAIRKRLDNPAASAQIARSHQQRRTVVAAMEAELAQHQEALKRIDALAPDNTVVTAIAPLTDTDRVLAALAGIQRTLSLLLAETQRVKQQSDGAVFVTWYSPGIYTVGSALIIGWNGQVPQLYAGVTIPEDAFIAVVLPDQSCFNNQHGLFGSVANFALYIDTYYTNELELGRVVARSYEANPDAEPTQPASTRAPLVQDVALHQVPAFRIDSEDTQ